ncbi:MAG: hypothetical protein US70_C0002G0018 [Parcubacteria group bacterium GW2011_GWD2_38_11]|nr:MAG: hypothetical protein US70_C0002G0018 [Parcubacteria group bacterium GW2011_GWD2_38_11]
MNKKIKETKKELGLDDIARIVQNGFLKIDERFDGMNKRFDGVEERLDGVEERLDGVEERLASVEKKIDRIEGEIIKKVDTVKYNTTKYRVKKLEEKFA